MSAPHALYPRKLTRAAGSDASGYRDPGPHGRIPAAGEVPAAPMEGDGPVPTAEHGCYVAPYLRVRPGDCAQGVAARRAGHRVVRHTYGSCAVAGHRQGSVCGQVCSAAPARDYLV